MKARVYKRPSWRWKAFFAFSVALTAALLLSPGEALLAAKVWVASWLPYARAIEEANWSDHSDKLVHFALFALLGVLAARIWWALRTLGWVLLGLVGFGLLTEALQNFIPGRGASAGDFLADMLGLASGAWWSARRVRCKALPDVLSA